MHMGIRIPSMLIPMRATPSGTDYLLGHVRRTNTIHAPLDPKRTTSPYPPPPPSPPPPLWQAKTEDLMPISTSVPMALVMAHQFFKLQAPHFHKIPSSGNSLEVLTKPNASPLRVTAWQRALAKHPDQEWVRAI